MHTASLLYAFVGGRLGWSVVLANMSGTVVNLVVPLSKDTVSSLPLDVFPERELLPYRTHQFLLLGGSSLSPSPLLLTIWLFYGSHSNGGDSSLWFQFALPDVWCCWVFFINSFITWIYFRSIFICHVPILNWNFSPFGAEPLEFLAYPECWLLLRENSV